MKMCHKCKRLLPFSEYHHDKAQNDGLRKICKECAKRTTAKHLESLKAATDGLYGIWRGMKRRCEDMRHKSYPRYGGRGIAVCEEWQTLGGFVAWATSHGYRRGLQIDRIDNGKGYSPENCRWVTALANTHNRRSNVMSDELAGWIRSRHADGMRVCEIWRELAGNGHRMSQTMVLKVCQGKGWRCAV
jgi:hypothetical protein